MANRSVKGKRRGDAQVELPKPSITLDVVMPLPGGGTDQRRPTFSSFGDAIDALDSLAAGWKQALRNHEKAARKK